MHPILTDYLAFLLKTSTVFFAIAALLVLAAILVARSIAASQQGRGAEGTLRIKKLHERFDKLAEAIGDVSLSPKARKKAAKERAKRDKKREKAEESDKKRLFVLDFKGDRRASATQSLRNEITAILGTAQDGDEVLVRLESPGGGVSDYGLAASQLQRIRDAGVPLTAVVDKVAASGGYMMAVVADRIVCAPFAAIGSIGVVLGMPNVHRLLREKGVDFEQITAGKYKRTLTVFGENTDEGREKMQAEMTEVHDRFKQLVATFRPQLDLEQVATGEWWLGSRALELGLVDAIGTSDDLLLQAAKDKDVLAVQWQQQRGFAQRFAGGVEVVAQRVLDVIASA